MESLISFIVPVLLFLPFVVLFVLLRRYEKERFWRWFIIYSGSALLGGFISVILFELAFPVLEPLQAAYLDWAAKVLARPGNSSIFVIFVRLHLFVFGLVIWYSGVGIAVWMVWRRHILRRRMNDPAPQSGAK